MISLFLWLSFKNLKKWFSYRNDIFSEVFLRWFSFSEMPIFQKIQAMIFTHRWPQFLCLKNSLFNDKENDILYVMIKGKSPWFRNEGAGLVIEERGHIEREPQSFRNDHKINLQRKSMINLYMISFSNDGHFSYRNDGHRASGFEKKILKSAPRSPFPIRTRGDLDSEAIFCSMCCILLEISLLLSLQSIWLEYKKRVVIWKIPPFPL